MIAKTLSFGSPGKLSIHNRQLVYDGENGVHRTFPVEDVGFVILETGRILVTTACLQALAEANVAVVVCGASHGPLAQLLPFAANTTNTFAGAFSVSLETVTFPANMSATRAS